ncbi:MAG: hypothetical protein JWR37_3554, partial [Mycobacterium sp.]|nr:hypothetical protein [Mycobacterium sp.]
HHGNLRVESKPGNTRFIIVLPLDPTAPETTAPLDTPETVSPSAE